MQLIRSTIDGFKNLNNKSKSTIENPFKRPKTPSIIISI